MSVERPLHSQTSRHWIVNLALDLRYVSTQIFELLSFKILSFCSKPLEHTLLMISRWSASSANPIQMCDPTLIGLPREIRDEIYKLVLFEHEVIYPYDYGESSRYNPRMFRHGPQIAILRVNRQLNAEGTEVL